MFGLFKKSYESEMADYDQEAKRLGPKIAAAMQSFDIMGQMTLVDKLNELTEKRIDCCKRHGKLENMSYWISIGARGKELRG